MADGAPPPYEEKAPVLNEGAPPAEVHQASAPQPSPSSSYQPPAAQPTVVLQQPTPQFVTVAQTTTPYITVVHGIKEAACYQPYLEFCPYCNKTVTTTVRYEWGNTTWLYCIISLIICWPLIFAICCNCSKDAHHYCPCCSHLLGVKKRR